jgi:hypothetical protein
MELCHYPELAVRFFLTTWVQLKEKIVQPIRVCSAQLLYKNILCLSRVVLCFNLVNFASHKIEKEGAERGKELKNFPGRSASQRRAKTLYK